MVVDTTRCLGHASADRGGDDITRRQVLLRMDALHDPRARGVVQDRTLAADRLGHQRLLPAGFRPAPHHGRVELDELEIAHRQPGAQRHRNAVAGDRRRVRRRCEHLPVAAACDHDRSRGDRADGGDRTVVVDACDPHAHDLVGPVDRSADHEVEAEGVVHHVDPGAERRLVERALHLGAGPVATGVDDAIVAVPALAGEGDVQVETGRGSVLWSGSNAAPRRIR